MAIATFLAASTFLSTDFWHSNDSWSSEFWSSEILSWSTLGYLFIVIGVVATLFSKHRYLLGFLVAGMAYWLVVEGLQSSIMYTSSLNSWHSYIAALSFTWLVPSLFLMVKHIRNAKHTGQSSIIRLRGKGRTPLVSQDKYIEHTPIYDKYTPRFHN